MRGAPKLPNNVTSTFFNTVYLLWKTCFEHGGPKLASCPGRHLTSSRPCRCLPHSTHKTHIWRHLLLYPGLLWKYKGARMRAQRFLPWESIKTYKGYYENSLYRVFWRTSTEQSVQTAHTKESQCKWNRATSQCPETKTSLIPFDDNACLRPKILYNTT